MSEPIVPDAIADRYGRSRRRPTRRWPYWTLLAVVVLAGVGVTIALYRSFGAAPITTQTTAFHVLDDHSVRVDFEVTRDDPRRAADCVVRARDHSGTETGRREVYIPPTSGTASITTVLATTNRPATGEVYGCSYQVPEYLSRRSPPSG